MLSIEQLGQLPKVNGHERHNLHVDQVRQLREIVPHLSDATVIRLRLAISILIGWSCPSVTTMLE